MLIQIVIERRLLMTHTFLRVRKWSALIFHLISCFPPSLISDQVRGVGSVACALPKVIMSRRRRVVGQKKKTRCPVARSILFIWYTLVTLGCIREYSLSGRRKLLPKVSEVLEYSSPVVSSVFRVEWGQSTAVMVWTRLGLLHIAMRRKARSPTTCDGIVRTRGAHLGGY
ncbi:hypothetical protein ARMGADRAFT_486592 [Armillaria gallica]|uniref:Uncharacterized protein n=1 Tax=Armillaria gallica TaxID=47427 RepID=A0A2H3DUZ6_ARMGA|nr:hypothetical protein ARMGADRAFT_486592 [Armillaria gallica]